MTTQARKKTTASGTRRSASSTTGIRFSQADKTLVAKLAKPDETTADVIRRALHALEHQEWILAAQHEAERIDAAGEDLNKEPDAW
ncbi:hypothetical protein [Nocardia arizonensis]|uniref:hypothetical protein n=1 Tax=Nocardia arizonensis TaxID=1141647 RepID=UPI0006CF344A|nr:hypothetical protein [Nocardia arizonensis]